MNVDSMNSWPSSFSPLISSVNFGVYYNNSQYTSQRQWKGSHTW